MPELKKPQIVLEPGGAKFDEVLESLKVRGRTDLFSVGDSYIDTYLGGGYGIHNNYEIVVVFGASGRGKSSFASQMLIDPLKKGRKVAFYCLEDNIVDAKAKLAVQLGINEKFISQERKEEIRQLMMNCHFVARTFGYTLDWLVEQTKMLFTTHDVVVIDPIQFIFEISITEKQENEWNRQRIFLNKMNALLDGQKDKVLIIVTHISKGNKFVYGDDKILGSSGIRQIATKTIEIGFRQKPEDTIRCLRLWKTRKTEHRMSSIPIKIDPDKFVFVPQSTPRTQQEWAETRETWGRSIDCDML